MFGASRTLHPYRCTRESGGTPWRYERPLPRRPVRASERDRTPGIRLAIAASSRRRATRTKRSQKVAERSTEREPGETKIRLHPDHRKSRWTPPCPSPTAYRLESRYRPLGPAVHYLASPTGDHFNLWPPGAFYRTAVRRRHRSIRSVCAWNGGRLGVCVAITGGQALLSSQPGARFVVASTAYGRIRAAPEGRESPSMCSSSYSSS